MGPAMDRWDRQVQRQDALLSDVFFTKLAAMSLLSPARAKSFPSGLNLPGRRELKREWHRMFLTGHATCELWCIQRRFDSKHADPKVKQKQWLENI